VPDNRFATEGSAEWTAAELSTTFPLLMVMFRYG
jgi:hypothetical protein